MRRVLSRLAAVLLACAAAAVAVADSAPTPLDLFLKDLRSWQTEFTQSIRDARGRAQPALSGKLWIERPGRFRWQLGTPEPVQIMVADGRNLWFYDRDLEQVTVRRSTDSLSASPASLLAGSVPLREAFSLESLPRRAGLEWVQVTPKQDDAEFRVARFGFAAGVLRRMELADKLGQQVVLEFTRSTRNQPVAAELLRFVKPEGADLIGTPIEP